MLCVMMVGLHACPQGCHGAGLSLGLNACVKQYSKWGGGGGAVDWAY